MATSLDSNPILTPAQTAEDREALARFVAWAIRAVGGQATRENGQVQAFLPPNPLVDVRKSRGGIDDDRPAWLRGPMPVVLTPALDVDVDELTVSTGEQLTPRSPQVEWLVERLHSLGAAVNGVPVHQPASAGEIAERLLPAYRIEGGRIRLSGCSLEDRAFFRIYARSPAGARPQRFVEWTIDADGRRVDEQVAAPLGLDDIEPIKVRPPAVNAAAVAELTHLAENGASQAHGPLEIVGVALLWCKWASGRLRIEFPSACAEIRFSDWAATLAPPTFACPETGRQSHAVGITDDGRIAAAEEIAVCQETSRRTLRRELVQCATSGELALAELVDVCPITERPVLRRLLAVCGTCGEQVSPAVIHDGECQACRKLEVAQPSDPRIARVLGEFPALDSWRKWRIAETAKSYILVGSGVLKRLLVVLDRQTLEPKRVATAGRLNRSWSSLPREQWTLELGRSESA